MNDTAIRMTKQTQVSETSRQVHSPRSSIQTMDVLMAEEPLLRRIIAGTGLTGADAEDILQETSIKALQVAQSWATHLDCRRWLARVTINACVTEHRRFARVRRHEDALGNQQQSRLHRPGSATTAMAREESDLVHQAMAKLEQTLLLPIVLKYFCDLSSQEISLILRISPEAVRARLYQGRLRLAKTLTQRGLHHGP